MVKVVVDEAKCDGDGTCVNVCPVAVFEMQEKGGRSIAAVIAEDQCIVCQACVVQCPAGAITVEE